MFLGLPDPDPFCRSLPKIAGSGSVNQRYGSPDLDPYLRYQNVTRHYGTEWRVTFWYRFPAVVCIVEVARNL